MKHKETIAAALCLGFISMAGSVYADDASSSGAPTAAPQAGSTPLQGGVEKTMKGALVGLRSFGEALHRLRRASGDLYGECTRRESDLVTEPDVIGTAIIYIPINVNVSDCLPPRKKWVDHWMEEMKELMPLVQGDLDGILYPDDKATAVAPLQKDIEAVMQDSDTRYQHLTALAQSGPYDGQAMADECKKIDDDYKQAEKLRKQIRDVVEKK